ncbi:MAG: dihydrofolate reductase [Desulfitibacter sp. BRH_c19]|nr:MAG: dihydrofolate reductase [Desulfitibacter sp. BRH_c19]
MKAIVAVDLYWGIGYKGELLQWIPEDLKFFKEKTLGKVVIMGRETFESLPGKKPLKDRLNVVLSKNEKFENENLTICRSLDELFSTIANYPIDDVFVIGGESIYAQLLPFCSQAYVTKIQNTYVADKYFINLDKLEAWEEVSTSEMKNYDHIQYSFVKYVNNKVKENTSPI